MKDNGLESSDKSIDDQDGKETNDKEGVQQRQMHQVQTLKVPDSMYSPFL